MEKYTKTKFRNIWSILGPPALAFGHLELNLRNRYLTSRDRLTFSLNKWLQNLRTFLCEMKQNSRQAMSTKTFVHPQVYPRFFWGFVEVFPKFTHSIWIPDERLWSADKRSNIDFLEFWHEFPCDAPNNQCRKDRIVADLEISSTGSAILDVGVATILGCQF